MNNSSVSVLVVLVLIGSFAVRSDAAAYYGPNYGPPRRYGGYNRYNRYARGYGGNTGWNRGWRGRRKYY
uniref:Foot protein-3 variant14 n=1 Tax=Mytilus edulis TaxID=6550 RepID=Q9N6G6_MYTED|nr:foot protein-3 precursor variant7 [Mytilus edulis]AAF89293.1 foot protein-3 precursor variant14 [Mytilus edulis]